MALPKMTMEQTDWLVQSLVHAAWIDGKVSSVEVALIERVMTSADWDEDAKRKVRRMMDGRDAKPELKLPPPTMTYEQKVVVFQDMVSLVFADGRLDKVEQDLVMKVANALGLHLSDMQAIWTRAKRHHDLGG
jgi:uncharacterized tellurite resistance protein B-like protein